VRLKTVIFPNKHKTSCNNALRVADEQKLIRESRGL